MGFLSGNRRRRNNQLDELNGMFGGPDVGWQTATQPTRGKGGGGFFGQGGAGRSIAGYIGDALAQMGGIQPVYAPAMEQQRRLSLYQMQREQGNEDWMNRQNYEAKTRPPPQPGEYERALAASGIQPGTPEWREAMARRAQSMEGTDLQFLAIPPGGSIGAVNRRTGVEVGVGGAGQPVRVSSEAEVARLPSGALFIGPDGVTRRKP